MQNIPLLSTIYYQLFPVHLMQIMTRWPQKMLIENLTMNTHHESRACLFSYFIEIKETRIMRIHLFRFSSNRRTSHCNQENRWILCLRKWL